MCLPTTHHLQVYATSSMEHEIEMVKTLESDLSEGVDGGADGSKKKADKKKSKNPVRTKRVTRRSEAAAVQTLTSVSLWRFARCSSGMVHVNDALTWMDMSGFLSEGISSALALDGGGEGAEEE